MQGVKYTQEVPPLTLELQMWDVRNLQDISLLAHPLDQAGSQPLSLPGELGLGEADCFPVSWGGVPTYPWGVFSIEAPGNHSEASSCSQRPAYWLQNRANHTLSQSHGPLLPTCVGLHSGQGSGAEPDYNWQTAPWQRGFLCALCGKACPVTDSFLMP